MAWKDSARRSLIGDQVVLVSTGGALWIRPKKLSIAALDEICDIRNKAVVASDRKKSMKQAIRLQEKHPGLFEGQGVEDLDTEERLEILELYSSLRTGANHEVYRISIVHGVGEHNFVDEKGDLLGRGQTLDSKTVDEILEWGDLATEIYKAIEGYNSPLAKMTGGISPTSPSGSSAAPTSDPTPASSPTVATPQS